MTDGVVLRTLLVSDLVASTRLVEQLGDQRAAEVFARHDRTARDMLAEHGGLEIDKTDGFLLLFERPLSAVLYALAYHRRLEGLSEELGVELASRVGIHLGEVVLRENPAEDVARGAKPLEVEGLAKPTAARLMSLAEGKQTLLSRGAFDLARRAAVDASLGDQKVSWLAHGPYQLEGVVEPVEVFEVGIDGLARLSAPSDSSKAYRIGEEGEILGWRPAQGLAVPERPHWTLDDKLGEGGFGEVWLARHRKTHDLRVFKFCFDANRLRGLHREITLFRLLKETLGDRDDIVRIRDWKLDAPPYYIESDYTEGGNLLEWAEAQGGLESLPLPIRVEIVAQVAEALAAAHSVGVLHKDVKPANVLVRGGGPEAARIQLTDFGIGLAIDRERLVQAGITILGMTSFGGTETATTTGTQRYMAPEVIEGHAATVQADIYALGVVLYQMVAGDFRRVLAPGWEHDVDDELLREDIALCVDRSPQRRLGDAQRLADNLRTLDERRERRAAERREREAAEQARIAFERSRKRRRLAAAATVVTTLFGAAMGFQSWRVAREAERANREAEAARQVSEFMVDLFEVSNPGEARGNSITAREVLDAGAERIDRQLTDQPRIRARLMASIGRVYQNLGLYEPATRLLEQALAVRRDLPGDRRLELADSLNQVGYLYWMIGKYDEAEPLLRQALEIRERALGGDHLEVARVLDNLGSLYEIEERFAEAEPLHRRALAIREAKLGPEDLEVAASLDDLAVLHLDQGLYAEAEPYSRRGLEIREKVLGNDHPAVATSLNGLAILCAYQDRDEEAEMHFKRSLEIRRNVLGPEHDDVAQSLLNLGFLYEEMGRSAESVPMYRQALTIWESALGSEHRKVAQVLNNLAFATASLGQDAEAEGYFHRALAVWRKAYGEDHYREARLLRGLASLLMGQQRLTEAEPLLRRALEIWARVPEPDASAVDEVREDLATLLRATGRGSEAVALGAAEGIAESR